MIMSPISAAVLLCACLVTIANGHPPMSGVRSVKTQMIHSNIHGGIPIGVGMGSMGHIGGIGGINGLGGMGGMIGMGGMGSMGGMVGMGGMGAMGGMDPYTLGMQHGAAKGFKQGTVNGFQQGQRDGFVKGKVTGVQKGMQAGFHQGKVQGFQKGNVHGFQHGSQHGFQDGKIQGFVKGKMNGFKAGIGSVNRLSNHLMATSMPYMHTFGGSGYGGGMMPGMMPGFGGSMYGGPGLSHGLTSGHGMYGSGIGVAGGTVTLGVHQPRTVYGGRGGYAPIHSNYKRNYGSGRNYNPYSRFH